MFATRVGFMEHQLANQASLQPHSRATVRPGPGQPDSQPVVAPSSDLLQKAAWPVPTERDQCQATAEACASAHLNYRTGGKHGDGLHEGSG